MRSRRERKGQFSCLQVEKNNPQNFSTMNMKWILKVWVSRLEINFSIK